MAKKSSGGCIGTGWFLTVLWVALGYFIYDGINGAMGVLVLCLLYNLAIPFSFIPFIGVIIQGLVCILGFGPGYRVLRAYMEPGLRP